MPAILEEFGKANEPTLTARAGSLTIRPVWVLVLRESVGMAWDELPPTTENMHVLILEHLVEAAGGWTVFEECVTTIIASTNYRQAFGLT